MRREIIYETGEGGGVEPPPRPPLPVDDSPRLPDTGPVTPAEPVGAGAVPPPQTTQGSVAIFGEFRFGNNGEVRASAASQGEPSTIVAPLGTLPRGMVFAERALRGADEASARNGIGYLYYEGVWDALPNFNALTPVKAGATDNFTLAVSLRPEHFALLFNGYINIPAGGSYTFYTTSDDGSRLWIGRTLVVENDGQHGGQERFGNIELVQGRYEITVAFFQKEGGAVLEVKYEGPGISKQTIPPTSLFRSDALYLYHAGYYQPALNRTPGSFFLAYAHQDKELKDQRPLFYEDAARTFFVEPERALVRAAEAMATNSTYVYAFSSVQARQTVNLPPRWKFRTYYHPYVSAYVRELNGYGVPGLFNRTLQSAPHTIPEQAPPMNFVNDYQPVASVVATGAEVVPVEEVDVSPGGAYSLYNWELFFHAPLLIADRLSKNQRFEEAQQWFHYIFDPTDRSNGPTPDRFWRFKQFDKVVQESIEELLEVLASDSRAEKRQELQNQVKQWQDNPFNAHLIARMRIPAYQKTVVMKYIDNLIAWGDQLFRRDTIESINEATLLYIVASDLLGPRPQTSNARGGGQPKTFAELDTAQDDFLTRIETLIPPEASGAGAAPSESPEMLTAPSYFCIPKNPTLLKYWDTVADRLFKIRHCMNIEGAGRNLPLFEPPIDPALLVRAAAAGVDLSSVLNDVNASLPHYRFQVMAQKATELCADLKALGSSFLAALEKRDAEAVALLRSGHERRVLEAVKQVRERQIDESKDTFEGLKLSQQVTEIRRNYYRDIERIIAYEQLQLDQLKSAHEWQERGQIADIAATTLSLLPDFDFGVSGWSGSPVAKLRFGGLNLAASAEAASRVMNLLSTSAANEATRASIMGGYLRRSQDWKLQEELAEKELEQIDKQILAAEIRVELAEKELENHELQIANATQTDTFMRDKFTNRELYDWMVSQISATYFQSYQLAYDVAKRAERAYRYELGLKDSSFIQFGYWDSLKKGLLAGERLSYDLKRMDVAFLDQNKREYEIVKHISLRAIDPIGLVKLKETGECFVTLPEALFDVDCPGHYMRRIKSVGLTVPCVAGPYTGINCTLTLDSSTIRHGNTLSGGKYARQVDDPRFSDSVGTIQSIVTSTAQNDTGLFEPNLRDERYLPFEGQGAISIWRLELPTQFKSFDYDTITDVVFHLRYTAREGGQLLKDQAAQELQAALNEFIRIEGQQGLAQVLSLRHEFSTQWSRFLNAPAGASQTLTMALTNARFPFLFHEKVITISAIELLVKVKPEFKEGHNESTLKLSLQAGAVASNNPLALSEWNENELLLTAEPAGGPTGDWTLAAWLDTGDGVAKRLDPDAIQDILAVCRYTCS